MGKRHRHAFAVGYHQTTHPITHSCTMISQKQKSPNESRFRFGKTFLKNFFFLCEAHCFQGFPPFSSHLEKKFLNFYLEVSKLSA